MKTISKFMGQESTLVKIIIMKSIGSQNQDCGRAIGS